MSFLFFWFLTIAYAQGYEEQEPTAVEANSEMQPIINTIPTDPDDNDLYIDDILPYDPN